MPAPRYREPQIPPRVSPDAFNSGNRLVAARPLPCSRSSRRAKSPSTATSSKSYRKIKLPQQELAPSSEPGRLGCGAPKTPRVVEMGWCKAKLCGSRGDKFRV